MTEVGCVGDGEDGTEKRREMREVLRGPSTIICFVIKIGKKASASANRNTTEDGTVEEREDRMGGSWKRRQTSDLRPSKANFESAT